MSLFLEIVLLTLFDVGHHETQYAFLNNRVWGTVGFVK